MRFPSIAVVALLTLSSVPSLRADYALRIVTPENVGEVGNLKVEAKADSFGIVRFVVRREGPLPQGRLNYLKGMLRLEVGENVWTEAPVVADAREGATEYRFAVAPAHLDIASFHVIQTEGLGGEWYEIPLKAFAPKEEAESIEATKKESVEPSRKEASEAPATVKEEN